MKKLLFILTILLSAGIIRSQQVLSPILFIYDASGSMWGQLEGKTKKELAAEVLKSTVTKLPENQEIG